jgi:hypothetical protein
MNIFIDDSGSFSWTSPGISLFCGLTVPDRDLAALQDRWLRWKRSIIGKSKEELKGCDLTEGQLDSFSYRVLPPIDQDVWLTYVGADTRRNKEQIVATYRDQAADALRACSDFMKEHKNKRQMQQYLEMSGWIRRRSTANVLWMFALGSAIEESLQHSIARFLEPEDDAEYRKFNIAIDQSFISRHEHITFWMEWLRQRMRNDGAVMKTLDEWRKRDHPWNELMKDGLLNVTTIYRDDMGFQQSHKVIGLQIADVCAHIALRYWRGEKSLAAYKRLRPRIVGIGGKQLTIVEVMESAIRGQQDPRKRVHEFNVERWKERARAAARSEANA